MESKNVKLLIEYLGTSYYGWQIQPSLPSVQGVLQEVIQDLTKEKCRLFGASRTDAGVHAIGQTANFVTTSSIPPDKFSYALNRILPADIVISKSCEVPKSFHSRFSAIGKKYKYVIYSSPFRSAILDNRAYHVSHKLNINKMQEAANLFLGTHDFSAFCAAGGNDVSPIRTLTSISITLSNNLLEFEISGHSFLYNMVRIIVGTLVQVGVGKIQPKDIIDIINSRSRSLAGKTVPACGLYLMEVYY